MKSIERIFFIVFVFFGSLFAHFLHAEGQIALTPLSLESRLELLMSVQEDGERLHHLFDLYWDWHLAENPDEATFLGYPGKHDQWPDLSSEGIERRQFFTKQLLNILTTFSSASLNEEDKVSLRIIKRMLEEEKANAEFCSHYLLIDQMDGIHLSTLLVIGLMPTKTIENYDDILSRLRSLPTLFQQATNLLEKGIESGITPPQIAIRNVPQQILNLMTENPHDSPFLKAFNKFPDSMDGQDQSRLIDEAKTIYQQKLLPALNKFYSYLTERYIPNCRTTIAFSDLPQGHEWYAHLVQSMTTTNLTAHEIHVIGLKEVARIYEEMKAVIKLSGFNGSFLEFLQFIKNDSQFFYSNREELMTAYQKLTKAIESKLPLLFAKLPSLPFEVVPVPSYSEESQIGAYYCPGSLADRRPGYFFINTSFPELRPKWEMEPLALHEAVPGHHLQITLAQELKEMPEFRKNANFTAYIEGWGLYAESLGSELGLYQNPYSIFGRLSYEMLRAMRLVVDTGMHAMGWSRDQAIDFFKQYVGMSNHEIVTEVDRYLVLPGQALAYKIGELKIQEMRHWATMALGEHFDIKVFHHSWLQHGTLPLDIAENEIHQWVNQSLTHLTQKRKDE
jgi:uncharacterized protein (DUF885 family)